MLPGEAIRASTKVSAPKVRAVVERAKAARDSAFNEFQELPDGKGGTVRKRVMNTYAVASLGGATMDNEWNYIHQKLMHSLGVVFVENQARI